MLVRKFAAGLVIALSAAAAEMPLPVLRIEATGGGSIFYVKNTSAQPLTAYLIELVNYPGSAYSLWQEEITGDPIPPGVEKRIAVNNMTVGAVPDYVKLQAAVFADGSSSGIAEKVTQIVERRHFLLATTRELIARLGKPGASKAELIADLRQWSESSQGSGKQKRDSQEFINHSAARGLIGETAGKLDKTSVEDTLASLRAAERALASSKQ